MNSRLQEEFAARDWFAVEQHDPYLAMAELCLRDRAQAARAAWGLQRMEQIALVVLEPQQWAHLANLTAAVGRYVPLASVWTVVDDQIVALGAPAARAKRERKTGIAPSSRAQAGTNAMVPSATVGSQAQSPPAPRSTASAAPPAAPSTAMDDSQRISRQEIEMLLRDDSDDSA